MSNNSQNPYVRDFLVPERIGGGSGRAYQLTADSVSLTRVVGRDEAGHPIEETVPAAYWQNFVMLDGGINKVPLRTAAVFSMDPQHERYENMTTKELVIKGCIPLRCCPYTQQFFAVTGTRYLVDNPEKTEDCGGSPNATNEHDCCVHMKPLIEKRRKRARQLHDECQRRAANMTPARAANMMRDMAEAFGIVGEISKDADTSANADAPDAHIKTKAARARLRDGKGEE